jgi:predicted transcriptional regulator
MMAQLNRLSPPETGRLFPLKGQFRIAELRKADALGWSDHVKTLKDLIVVNESMYPNIDRWFTAKVVPGLKSTERIAYVAYEDENPIASAILKRGRKAKFCHLRIREDFQDQDLGQIFFTQMIFEIRHEAEEIHFTLPESLWCKKSGFFKSFGFSNSAKASRQYRRGDTELACSAPFQTVWSALREKLPELAAKFFVGKYSLGGEIVMSVKPKYAERLLAGAKVIEIRKRFSKKWLGCKAILYASQPVSALVGEATINSITFGPPDEVWTRFESNIGCTRAEFEAYAASRDELCAIEMTNVLPYLAPVPLDQISSLLRQHLTPPQSYCEVKDGVWAGAVSIASLLHGRFGRRSGGPGLGRIRGEKNSPAMSAIGLALNS